MTEEHAGRHYQPKLLAVPGPGDLVKVASRTTLQTRRTQRIGCGKEKLHPRAGHVCKERIYKVPPVVLLCLGPSGSARAATQKN